MVYLILSLFASFPTTHQVPIRLRVRYGNVSRFIVRYTSVRSTVMNRLCSRRRINVIVRSTTIQQCKPGNQSFFDAVDEVDAVQQNLYPYRVHESLVQKVFHDCKYSNMMYIPSS